MESQLPRMTSNNQVNDIYVICMMNFHDVSSIKIKTK